MRLHELHAPAGSRHARKRIGRGIAAGQGKTSGRGQKGAGARQGAKVPRGFEGGQMKITMRLPKLRGFANRWRTEYQAVNVGKLNRFPAGAIVDGAALFSIGLLAHPGDRVKLLAAGRVQVAVTVRVHRASAAARRAVEAAGGRLELLEAVTAPTAEAEAEPVVAPAAEPVAAPVAKPATPEAVAEPAPVRRRRARAAPADEPAADQTVAEVPAADTTEEPGTER
jgi:large subunit ribosomal protein L15